MTLVEEILAKKIAMTVGELADLLHVSDKTVYKAIKSGGLPALHPLPSIIRLDPQQAADWLANHTTAKTPRKPR
jgi:excisionase family DNA binding protein